MMLHNAQVIKMNSGDEVIGVITKITNKTITIENPTLMEVTNQQVKVSAWIKLTNQMSVEVPLRNIQCTTVCATQLLEAYTRYVLMIKGVSQLTPKESHEVTKENDRDAIVTLQ